MAYAEFTDCNINSLLVSLPLIGPQLSRKRRIQVFRSEIIMSRNATHSAPKYVNRTVDTL
jgi:hypothetical protein